MNTSSITRYMILGLLVFVTACSPLVVIEHPASGAPLPTALPTQNTSATNTAPGPTIPEQTPTQAAATATPVPATPTQPEAEQPAATSAPAVTECQDSAQYISDDGLDGTTYAPNAPFTKTWTLKNTGSCTWDDTYLVAYISGATMTQQPGYWILPQGQTVVPGQTVNISIGMTSPPENGNYASYWGLEKRDGQLMPIQGGANGNSFYVKIKVNDGSESAEGKVTAASIDIELEQGSGTACTADSTYFVHASITADGPTTASYEIGSTAGQVSAGYFEDNGRSPYVTGTVVFDQAGTKTINLRFVGPYPYPADITVNIRVNGGEWHNTKLSCPQ
jgi:Ig-like domain-containing protein